MRALLVISIALPLAIFAVASWISYFEHFREAEDRLQRTLSTIYEHASKVFDTFELSTEYLEEVLTSASIEQIRANEAAYSDRLRRVIERLPQLRDLWIIDAAGFPVVSGTVHPMPQIDLSDRRYFSFHKDSDTASTYISEVLEARAANTKFFAITRARRDAQGRFNGVILVSIAPEYFSEYYQSLPDDLAAAYALVRTDGAFLARDPPAPLARIPAQAVLFKAMQAAEAGTVRGPGIIDNVERIYAYKKLPRYDVFVLSQIEVRGVVGVWLRAMSYHLIFGIPATLAMVAFVSLALRRTKREALAFANLQREVARRETTEQALRQAQKMEAVGRLTGGVAHDFNNLLTVILGNVDLALRRLDNADERINRLLSSARQGCLRAATLVQRLLAFSRQHPQEVHTVDINRLVSGMSEILHRTIGETITVETVLASGLWKGAIDPNQLENAIINMAVNARDAMPDGGRLTIETANAFLDEAYVAKEGGGLKHGQYVMLAISDTGAGMSSEVIENAFEPFYTTKPTGAGSGLGLSMVYGFVKQSNGHIKIYSEVGHGTAVKLYFPRLAEKNELPTWTGSDAPSPTRPAIDGASKSILVLEDDEEVRGFASEVLRDLGYRVETASNGSRALDLIRKHPEFVLLFTDVVLPGGMNGRQVAEAAQALRPDLKVLFATGYTRNAIIHHGRLDADVELLTKPFTADALARKVAQILGDLPTGSGVPSRG